MFRFGIGSDYFAYVFYYNKNSSKIIDKIGKYSFNPDLLTLTYKDKEHKLTLREAELLTYFVENKGKLVAREDILKSIWGSDDYFNGRSLDVFISRIRKYLKEDSSIKLENRHGIGFIFTIND